MMGLMRLDIRRGVGAQDVLQPEGLRLCTSDYAPELGTLMRTDSS